MQRTKPGYCEFCESRVRLERSGSVNHVLHLILTFLTAGLWLVVWVAAILWPKRWACSVCGSHAVRVR
jgi:hypothetical protein